MAATQVHRGARQGAPTPPPSPPHGRKRSAEHGLEGEQRLSKRFDLLNLIDNGTRLYIPVAGSSDAVARVPKTVPTPLVPTKAEMKKRHERPSPLDDSMDVEDTPNRVFIRDLSAELSDIESDEENPIFLSDIEKHLSKIPMHVLAGPELKPTADNQLVLYNVPSSLTVPREQDTVRKAIVESRARVRERQALKLEEPERVAWKDDRSSLAPFEAGTPRLADIADGNDPDAMDLD